MNKEQREAILTMANDRLTMRDTLGNAYCAYCDSPCAVDGSCPEECVQKRIDRLADYEDAIPALVKALDEKESILEQYGICEGRR